LPGHLVLFAVGRFWFLVPDHGFLDEVSWNQGPGQARRKIETNSLSVLPT
jgi:hypothetical protein